MEENIILRIRQSENGSDRMKIIRLDCSLLNNWEDLFESLYEMEIQGKWDPFDSLWVLNTSTLFIVFDKDPSFDQLKKLLKSEITISPFEYETTDNNGTCVSFIGIRFGNLIPSEMKSTLELLNTEFKKRAKKRRKKKRRRDKTGTKNDLAISLTTEEEEEEEKEEEESDASVPPLLESSKSMLDDKGSGKSKDPITTTNKTTIPDKIMKVEKTIPEKVRKPDEKHRCEIRVKSCNDMKSLKDFLAKHVKVVEIKEHMSLRGNQFVIVTLENDDDCQKALLS